MAAAFPVPDFEACPTQEAKNENNDASLMGETASESDLSGEKKEKKSKKKKKSKSKEKESSSTEDGSNSEKKKKKKKRRSSTNKSTADEEMPEMERIAERQQAEEEKLRQFEPSVTEESDAYMTEQKQKLNNYAAPTMESSGLTEKQEMFEQQQQPQQVFEDDYAEDHPVTSAAAGIVTSPGLVNGTINNHGAGWGGPGFGGIESFDDEALAVAIMVNEEEEEDAIFLPAAIEYDPDSKPPIHKNRRFRFYATSLVLMSLVLIGTIVAVAVMHGNANANALAYTFSPTSTPTTAPTAGQEGVFREQFAAVVGNMVYEKGSAHDRAADWIMFDDPMSLDPLADNLIQRYLLALFYFITTQNGPWKSCNQPGDGEDHSCDFQRFMRRPDDAIFFQPEAAIRWLSDQHECQWVGAVCDDVDVLRALELCKCGLRDWNYLFVAPSN